MNAQTKFQGGTFNPEYEHMSDKELQQFIDRLKRECPNHHRLDSAVDELDFRQNRS